MNPVTWNRLTGYGKILLVLDRLGKVAGDNEDEKPQQMGGTAVSKKQ
jgi:hypothetical protein